MSFHVSTSGIGALLAGALLLAGASPAWADPSPEVGPTTGGTAVSDLLPDTVFTDIAAGYLYSLALDSEGFAYGWGYNYLGTLGNGAIDNPAVTNGHPLPVKMPDGVRFSSISAGFDHAAALTEGGEVYTWGTNDSGQLGIGTIAPSYVPVKVTTPVPLQEVEAGWRRTWALGTDGKLYGWGKNDDGALGEGGSEDRLSAVQLPTPDGVTFGSISANDEHAIALGSDGRSYLWGRNSLSQLGLGTSDDVVPTPQPLPAGPDPLASAAAGKTHTIGVAADGKTYAWGDNWYGQVGNGTSMNAVATPAELSSNDDVQFTSVAAGWEFSAGIDTAGQVFAWGRNNVGQLGDGSRDDHIDPQPVVFPEPVFIKKISISTERHALALTDAGEIYAWGANEAGAVGDGSSVDALLPVKLTGETTVTEVLFGDLAGENLVQQGNTWTADTPGGCGPVDVTVRLSQFGRDRELVFPDGFTYGTAPAITAHPASATLTTGETFSAKVGATGDPNPTVAWQFSANGESDWEALPGDSVELSVAAASAGYYRAILSSCAGTVTSDAAKLTLNAKPLPDPGPGQAGTPNADLPSTGGAGAQPLIPLGAVLLLVGTAAVTLARRTRA